MRHLVLFFAGLSACIQLQASDYTRYHLGINRAEQLLFVRQQWDSGLQVYTQLFRDFDFVYTGDCVIALQMAAYCGREASFLNFTRKAFENGLTLQHLKRIPVIVQSPLYRKDTSLFEQLYRQHRPHYLRRIDTPLLKTMYRLFVNDQLVKNQLKEGQESDEARLARYRPYIRQTFKELDSLIAARGFPLDLRTGISQNDIMRELGQQLPDLPDYYALYREKNASVLRIEQFTADEELWYPKLLFPIFIHWREAFKHYSDSFYRAQIAAGNIHPKDIAFLNDNYYGYNNRMNPQLQPGTLFSAVGYRPHRMQANTLFVPDSLINRYRARWFMAPIEQDRQKWQFMQAHGMHFSWGYMGTRS